MTAAAANLTPSERALVRDAAARALLDRRQEPPVEGSLSHLNPERSAELAAAGRKASRKQPAQLTIEQARPAVVDPELEIQRASGRRGGLAKKNPRAKTASQNQAALDRLARRMPPPPPVAFSPRPAAALPLAAVGSLPDTGVVLKLARAVHGAEVADDFDLNEHLARVAEFVGRVRR